ncbi:MAG TPA: AraC family transcriptional regulator ligand-binding domain-containing protein [Agitococcus sp.]|nr:AraC family transcriptional regulator ligand-binding domain-containing protein [Agitococcus sp.]HNI62493.1 AraC family transcriptional regulator ligand-binding domain-containing protein [Agitococcus sp.]
MQGVYVASDLANLLRAYLDKYQIDAPSIRHQLAAWPPHAQMPMKVWWQLLEEMQTLLHEPALGVKIGQCVQPQHTGVLAYLIMHCATLGEALLHFQRFQKLLHNMSDVLLTSHQQALKLSWDLSLGASTQLSDEVFMSGLITFVKQMVQGMGLQPLALHFMHPAPCDPQLYQELIGCPVFFNAKQVSIDIPLEALSLTINSQNPYLLELLAKQAEALIDQSAHDDLLLETIRRFCAERLHQHVPTLDEVASTLNLSTRTLHRRLADRGLNFHHLLAETRFRLAKHYLSDPRLQLNQIALLLGYSEQSAFTRAFSAWAGISPQRFRNRSPFGRGLG